MKCTICGEPLTGQKKLYCSSNCQTKSWKIRNRETYLAGKKVYREKNLTKILEYKRIYLSKGVRPLSGKKKKVVIRVNNGVCFRCGSMDSLEVHHIKELRNGGTNKFSNLLIFCKPCHALWHKKMKGFFDIK
jgi:5-methylcytosine-specific restriction endonuclease McrA